MSPRSERSSVAAVTALLQRSGLLGATEAEVLQQSWQRQAPDPDNLAAFSRWLVDSRHLTQFQVALLLHGQSDHFFLGPYKLMERVGRGRLATVYRAMHRHGHTVALKVLPPSRARDRRALIRFRHEADLAAGLEHLHVVRTLDRGEDRGLHYLAMEYLEGQTLQQILEQKGGLFATVAAEVVRQALQGLQYLHEKGLVHRNLEPANLMLQQGGDDSGPWKTVKILDFSLVRSAPTAAAKAAIPGPPDEFMTLMAPAYRAPEMALDPETADVRADIYSLGCVLYHALTGRPPFADPNPMGQLIGHATETPLPLRQVNPELPKDLEPVVATMLAKEPASRYATPAHAALALDGFLHPVKATRLVVGVPPLPVVPVVPAVLPVLAAVEAPPQVPVAPPPVPPLLEPKAPLLPSSRVEPTILPDAVAWPASPPSSRKHRRAYQSEGLSRRDLWMLLLGGVGLLTAELLGWLMTLLLAARQ